MEATLLEIPFDTELQHKPTKNLPKDIALKRKARKPNSISTVTAKKKSLLPIDKVEALRKATEYFHGDTLAAQVWLDKYALKDSQGTIYEASPTAIHRRLSAEIARMEARYPKPLGEQQIFELIDRFKYVVSQGGPMTGIGNPFQVASLSNCFVIGHHGNADSYGAVMQTDEEQVQLMKRRGA